MYKGAENIRVRWIFWYLNQNRVGVNSALDETALGEDPLYVINFNFMHKLCNLNFTQDKCKFLGTLYFYNYRKYYCLSFLEL